MLAGVVSRFGEVHAEEVPMPEMGDYDALVKIAACAFCNGTDRHIIDGTFPFIFPLPIILGHESVGEVVEIGAKVQNYKRGDLVFRPAVNYKDVPGAPNSNWGGFAEYGTITDRKAASDGKPVRTMQQIIPEGIHPVEATVLIPVKETLSSLQMANLKAGQSLLIFGSGPVGMSFALCGKMLGASPVVMVGRRDERLKQTMDFGVDSVINSSKEDVVKRARELSGGSGFDLVVEAVGSYELINLAAKTVAHHGTVGVYGVPPVSRDEFQQFQMDCRGTPGNWSLSFINPDEPSTHDMVCGWVKHGLLPVERFISHTMPLSEIHSAYELIKGGDAIKIVLTMS